MKTRTRASRFHPAAALALTGLLLTSAPDAPVADAAMRGDADQVRALLRQGADVNAAQGDGMTALHWAAERGDEQIAEVLIFAGANVRAVTRNIDHTPLHLAARAGRSAVSKLLLDAGADPRARSSTGATPLHLAAAAPSLEIARQLIDAGAEVDARESAWDQTPLMWAASGGFLDLVDLLAERGADLSLASKVEDISARAEADRVALRQRNQRMDALIALAKAAEGGDTATTIIRSIDEQRPQREGEPRPLTYDDLVGKKGGLAALHFAARQGHRATVLRLLELGADIDQRSADRSTPLLLATINGHFDLAIELIDRGADPDVASDAGATPLYGAINLQWHAKSNYPQPQAFKEQRTTYIQLMEALLEAGADPDIRLEKTLWYLEYNFPRLSVEFAGSTAFWRAAYAQDVEAMRLLVKYGADPGIPTRVMPDRRFSGNDDKPEADPSGLPPVHVGDPGAYPIHAVTGVGFGQGYAGGFHRGVPGAWLTSVRYLVEELGADVNARDLDGNTPLHHAASRGDVEVIRFLIEKGADVMVVNRRGQTTADMANSPVQRVPVYPEALALLVSLGAKNNNKCQVC